MGNRREAAGGRLAVRDLGDAEASTTLAGAPSSHRAGTAALQLVALDAAGLAIFPLPESGVVTIGRGEDCDVRLGDALVSRRHALLRLNPLSIEDAGSANGTLLSGERVAPGSATRLQVGMAVSIGRSLLIVRRGHARAPSAEPGSATGGELASAGRNRVVLDPAMQKIYAFVERLGQGNINVLILGETGVGKEVVAEAIHLASRRRNNPLLRINCASLSEALLESELFGHERGAFTGAVAAKPGLIELAHTGTVLLDEVGELSPALQAKLLRVIETREAARIGGLRARRVDVRFLFATNRDLEEEVRCGRFRADLFFRLKGATLVVPPLRERPSEILPLAEVCLASAADQMQLSVRPVLSERARASLLAHAWPGNVRELRNVIERATLLCNSGCIGPDDLALDAAADPILGSATTSTEKPLAVATLGSLPAAPRVPHADSERERIAQALSECGGNQSRAAESLGMPRRTLVRRIAELGLPRPRRTG